MNRFESGLELATYSGPETVTPANLHLEDKYHEDWQAPKSVDKDLLSPPAAFNIRRSICGFTPVVLILATIAIVSLATALGVGLGEGLAARRRSSTSVSTKPPTENATTTASINILDTTTSTTLITRTAVPVHATTTARIDFPATTTPITQNTPTTTPAHACPSANGTMYTVNNSQTIEKSNLEKPTINTLTFEVLCDTNWRTDSHISDLQRISSVISLEQCVDTCANYTFLANQARGWDYAQSEACTGVVWTNGKLKHHFTTVSNECILKAKVTLSSANRTNLDAGWDGAVLVSA